MTKFPLNLNNTSGNHELRVRGSNSEFLGQLQNRASLLKAALYYSQVADHSDIGAAPKGITVEMVNNAARTSVEAVRQEQMRAMDNAARQFPQGAAEKVLELTEQSAPDAAPSDEYLDAIAVDTPADVNNVNPLQAAFSATPKMADLDNHIKNAPYDTASADAMRQDAQNQLDSIFDTAQPASTEQEPAN